MRKIIVDDILKMNCLLFSFFKENSIDPFEKILFFDDKRNIGNFYMEAALGWLKSNEPSSSFFDLGINECKVYVDNSDSEIIKREDDYILRKVLVKDFIHVNKKISNYILENEINTETPFYYSLDSKKWIKLTDYIFSLYNIYINFKDPSDDFFSFPAGEIKLMSEILVKKKTEN